MTRSDDERTAADVRYAKARRAAEALTHDSEVTEVNRVMAELDAAHREITRQSRRAGSEALKRGEPA